MLIALMRVAPPLLQAMQVLILIRLSSSISALSRRRRHRLPSMPALLIRL